MLLLLLWCWCLECSNICINGLQSHTILLVQPTKRPEGRTYADYESVNECMEGKIIFRPVFYLSIIFIDDVPGLQRIDVRKEQHCKHRFCTYLFCFLWAGVCKMYEEHLKRMNPNSPSITYDISQLFDFIDDLADLSCLV